MCEAIFWSSSDDSDEERDLAPPSPAKRQAPPSEVDQPRKQRTVADEDPPEQRVHAMQRLSTVDKAGLGAVDAKRMQSIIADATAGSAFAHHEEARRAKADAKLAKIRERLVQMRLEDAGPENFLKKARAASVARQVAKVVAELEAMRDLSESWLVVDMDAFYCACELRDNPSLKGKAFAVGGMSMLSTSSYEARAFGVRSAMPGFVAKKLCPELIIVPVDFDKYRRVAALIRLVFASYDANFSSGSLDEASLNITQYLRNHAGRTAVDVARELQMRVEADTQCTCSVGVACNRQLAKIASNEKKPRGLFEIPSQRDAIVAYMSTLPLHRVSGIGPVAEMTLTGAFAIERCGGLWQQRETLARTVSARSLEWYMHVALGFPASHMHDRAAGDDDDDVGRKSISCEHTVSAAGVDELETALSLTARLSERLAGEMQQQCIRGSTLTLKLKSVDFSVRSRSVSLPVPSNEHRAMWLLLKGLVEQEMRAVGAVRLIGVRMSALEPADPKTV